MEYLGTDKPVNKIQPVVSICVITYNHEGFISECLDSILNQEVDFLYEIILGEDCSTDGTQAICRAYAEKYPDKIRLFLRDEKNKVIINGRKTGRYNILECYKDSRGKYIAVCEGDDFWISPNKLQFQYETLEQNKDAVLTIGPWNKTETESRRIKEPVEFSKVYKKKETQPMPGHTSSVFFRNVIRSFPKYYYKLSFMDKYFTASLLNYGYALVIDQYISYYRVHEGGVFSSLDKTQITKSKFYDVWILFKHGRVSLRFFLSRLWGFLKWKLSGT